MQSSCASVTKTPKRSIDLLSFHSFLCSYELPGPFHCTSSTYVRHNGGGHLLRKTRIPDLSVHEWIRVTGTSTLLFALVCQLKNANDEHAENM
ncbi:Non-specific serine/threonine protein kinase [Psidium guajava]|nr:Non-specific serine/threonine protein kinase [Psidium guajava]